VAANNLQACDLCAIYRATNTRGESTAGFLLTVSEAYIPYNNLQFDGHPYNQVPLFNEAYMNSSITHIVPTYNFSELFGVSLNLPIEYKPYKLVQLVPGQAEPFEESGTSSGFGDMSLIGRLTPLRISEMKYSIVGSLFAGVKFPTGNPEQLELEVQQEEELQAEFGPGHNHPIGGIHRHDLTLGSGSFDGIFGAALTVRWDRWFLGMQGQYYLRTEALDYQFGNETMASGGPGAYILLDPRATLSLQLNASWGSMEPDTVIGIENTETGWRGWFLGPQLNFTFRQHFSANAGVDIPIVIDNNGFQSVPSFRFHGGLSWKF